MLGYTEEGHRREVLSLQLSVYHWVSAMHCTYIGHSHVSPVHSTQHRDTGGCPMYYASTHFTEEGHRRVYHTLCLYRAHCRGTQEGVLCPLSLHSIEEREPGGYNMYYVCAEYTKEGHRRVSYVPCPSPLPIPHSGLPTGLTRSRRSPSSR